MFSKFPWSKPFYWIRNSWIICKSFCSCFHSLSCKFYRKILPGNEGTSPLLATLSLLAISKISYNMIIAGTKLINVHESTMSCYLSPSSSLLCALAPFLSYFFYPLLHCFMFWLLFHELFERDKSRNALKILNKGIWSFAFIFTRDELDYGKVSSLNMYKGGAMSST